MAGHFFELADLRKAPLAVEAVWRIDELFAVERRINGLPAGDRLAARRQESKPIVANLETWMRTERARLSRHAETARAIDYMLTRWPAFTRLCHLAPPRTNGSPVCEYAPASLRPPPDGYEMGSALPIALHGRTAGIGASYSSPLIPAKVA